MSSTNTNSSAFTNLSTNNRSSNSNHNGLSRINITKNTNTMNEIKSFHVDLKSMLSPKKYEKIKMVASKKATSYRYKYLLNEIVSFLFEKAVSIRIVEKEDHSHKHMKTGDPLPTYVNISIKDIKYIKYITKYFLQLVEFLRSSPHYNNTYNRGRRNSRFEPVIARITIRHYKMDDLPINKRREILDLKNRWGTVNQPNNIWNVHRNEKYFKPTELCTTTQNKVRVNKNTELINKSFMSTKFITNIKPERRVYVNKPSDVRNDKTLIRLYDRKGIHKYVKGKTFVNLHGEKFSIKNIKKFRNDVNTVNQVVKNRNKFLRRIKNDIKKQIKNNQKISVKREVERFKKNRPEGTTLNDIANLVRNHLRM